MSLARGLVRLDAVLRFVPLPECRGAYICGVTTRRFFDTTEALAAAVRDGRAEQGLSQAELAERASVGLQFVTDLEAGQPQAELAKVLSVLEALDIHATALPGVARERPEIDLEEHVRRFA